MGQLVRWKEGMRASIGSLLCCTPPAILTVEMRIYRETVGMGGLRYRDRAVEESPPFVVWYRGVLVMLDVSSSIGLNS
jgi:hypothetical protein